MEKETIETLKLAEDIIDRRWKKSDEHYALLVCTCFALLTKFGEFYTPLIESLFKKVNIYIENKPLSKIIKNHNFNVVTIEEINDKTDFGIVSNGIDFNFDIEDGIVNKITSEPLIICSSVNKTNNTILNTIIHECSHLIKSSINAYYNETKGYYYIRNGLNLYEAKYQDGILYELFKYTILDETINTFQTTEMMMSLEKLKNYNESDNIKAFIKTLNFNELNKFEGYEFFCDLLIDLWNNQTFKDSVEDEIIIGDITSIINHFNSYTYQNAFETLDNLLDETSNNITDEKYDELKDNVTKINEIVKIYNKNTKEITKKK